MIRAWLIPLIVADVAFGSGHFNLALGIVGTATGIGASLSGAMLMVTIPLSKLVPSLTRNRNMSDPL